MSEDTQGQLIREEKLVDADRRLSARLRKLRLPSAWLEAIVVPKWIRTAPGPVREALVVDPEGRRLVRSLRLRWMVHCVTTSLPFVALALIAPHFPGAGARPFAALSEIVSHTGVAVPYVAAYAAPLAVTKVMTHLRFLSVDRVAKYAAKYIAKETERVRFLPRGDRQLSAERIAELNDAAARLYQVMTDAGERISNNSAVVVGCLAGTIVAGPLAGLLLTGVAGPALLYFHHRTGVAERERREMQDERLAKVSRRSQTLDSITTERGLTSIVGLGVDEEVSRAAGEGLAVRMSSLDSDASAGHDRQMKSWLRGSATSVCFMLAGAATGLPFVNMMVAVGACQSIGQTAGGIGRDMLSLEYGLRPTMAIEEARVAAQNFQERWGGTEVWRPESGPSVTLAGVSLERLGEGRSVPATLHFPPGSLTVLIGPNGCGKSSILRTLRGLRIPVSGEVLFDGIPQRRYGPKSINANSLFVSSDSDGQFPFVLERFFGARPHAQLNGSQGRNARDEAVGQLMELGIAPGVARALVDDPERAADVSKGQSDRTSLVTLHPRLSHDKWLGLFDEVAANLDYRGKQVAASLQRGLADRGTTVVSAAHTTELVSVADSVVLLGDKGHIIATGPPASVLIPEVPFDQYSSRVCTTEAHEWAYKTLSTHETRSLFALRDGPIEPRPSPNGRAAGDNTLLDGGSSLSHDLGHPPPQSGLGSRYFREE